MEEDKNLAAIENVDIESLIYTIRGKQVMIDSDLAKLYQVETRVFNQASKEIAIDFLSTFAFN